MSRLEMLGRMINSYINSIGNVEEPLVAFGISDFSLSPTPSLPMPHAEYLMPNA